MGPSLSHSICEFIENKISFFRSAQVNTATNTEERQMELSNNNRRKKNGCEFLLKNRWCHSWKQNASNPTHPPSAARIFHLQRLKCIASRVSEARSGAKKNSTEWMDAQRKSFRFSFFLFLLFLARPFFPYASVHQSRNKFASTLWNISRCRWVTDSRRASKLKKIRRRRKRKEDQTV